MLRRIIAITVIVVGLAVITAAIGSATFWRPDERVTATLPEGPEAPAVITAPGVLNMVNDTVQVRAVGATPETPVLVAMGREADVRAWLDDAPHAEITGLTTWEQLDVRQVEAPQASAESDDDAEGGDEGAEDESAPDTEEGTDGGTSDDEATDGDATDGEATEDAESDSGDAAGEGESADGPQEAILPDPAGSDLWLEEVTGTGEVTYEWTAVPGRWVMLAATDGSEPAPQVELTWDREVPTPLLIPGTIIGVVLALGGAVALVIFLLADKEAARARQARLEEEKAAALVPPRQPGRHREDVPEEELTYAQRLGWPSADAADATEVIDPVASASTAASSSPPTAASPTTASSSAPTVASGDALADADTGELPSGLVKPDGTPLTRRELREQERAREEAERAAARRRWWPFGGGAGSGGRTGSGDAPATSGDAEDVRSGSAQDGPTGNAGASGANDRPGVNAGADADSGAGATGVDADAGVGAAPGGAGAELSDWVASGRASAAPGPTGAYFASGPTASADDVQRDGSARGADAASARRADAASARGADVGAARMADMGFSDADTTDADKAGPDPVARGAEASSAEPSAETERSGKARPWWRRLGRGKVTAEPDPGPNEEPEPEPQADQEPDPHTSGARWRKTWGIQQEGQSLRSATGIAETQEIAPLQELTTQTPGRPQALGGPQGSEGGQQN
ncbi:MAG TPA: hypothetical protein VK063_01275 [Beutenbergiaceae bacterium]|nr:hypothetical protein [Beutenbergiaceae bacterium]